MSRLEMAVAGIGFWAPGWPDWSSAQDSLRNGAAARSDAPLRPTPTVLAPAERRRAPAPVLLACEVAVQASAASALDPAGLRSVFASSYGDLAITDYMCATLASAPHELSPVRFHNSVHNAPSGYWTIAAGCHSASTALSAWHASFGAALLEAAIQLQTEQEPVLLVAYDTEASGPLAEVSPSTPMFGTALVLVPVSARSGDAPRLRLHCVAGMQPAIALPAGFEGLAGNPMARGALPLLHALACGDAVTLALATSESAHLQVEVLT